MIRRTQEFVTPELEDYANLLIQLHQRIAAGNGDSDEANALRDHMDVYWSYLNEDQLAIARQLSADLYTVNDESSSVHPRHKDFYSPALAADMERAHQSKNFLAALKLLSERSSEISHDRAAVVRGISYRGLGLVQAGLTFMWSAAQGSQQRETALVAILNTLWHYVDVNTAALQAMDLLRNNSVQGIPLNFIVGCLL